MNNIIKTEQNIKEMKESFHVKDSLGNFYKVNNRVENDSNFFSFHTIVSHIEDAVDTFTTLDTELEEMFSLSEVVIEKDMIYLKSTDGYLGVYSFSDETFHIEGFYIRGKEKVFVNRFVTKDVYSESIILGELYEFLPNFEVLRSLENKVVFNHDLLFLAMIRGWVREFVYSNYFFKDIRKELIDIKNIDSKYKKEGEDKEPNIRIAITDGFNYYDLILQKDLGKIVIDKYEINAIHKIKDMDGVMKHIEYITSIKLPMNIQLLIKSFIEDEKEFMGTEDTPFDVFAYIREHQGKMIKLCDYGLSVSKSMTQEGRTIL